MPQPVQNDFNSFWSQKILSDSVELLYDLSKLAEMSEDVEETDDGAISIGVYGPVSSSSPSAKSFDCSAFKTHQEDEPSAIPLSNIRCADKAPNVILITGTQTLRRSEFIRRKSGKKTVYLYKIQNANKLMELQQDGVEKDPSVGIAKKTTAVKNQIVLTAGLIDVEYRESITRRLLFQKFVTRPANAAVIGRCGNIHDKIRAPF